MRQKIFNCAIDHRLHQGKGVLGFGQVFGGDGFFHVFHRSAVFGAQRGVGCIEFGVLANALAAGGKARVLFLGFG